MTVSTATAARTSIVAVDVVVVRRKVQVSCMFLMCMLSSIPVAAAFTIGPQIQQQQQCVSSHYCISNAIQQQQRQRQHALFAERNNDGVTTTPETEITDTLQHIRQSISIAVQPFMSKQETNSIPKEILSVCDAIDDVVLSNDDNDASWKHSIRIKAYEIQRYELLVQLLQSNYTSYIATCEFLSPSRIPRSQLPNVQDVTYFEATEVEKTATTTTNPQAVDANGNELLDDCSLPDLPFKESWLDQLLLSIFRKLVTKHTNGVTSATPGIDGLLEQGRGYMLQTNQTSAAQSTMVQNTLGDLMTPFLPPFYRIFMAGIVPSNEFFGRKLPGAGKQFGPWFYAPFLTSFVTPTFFGFLVGPSTPNRRKDGQPGGLVVEKCKFLQESGCKGLCLHQCKLPAQTFFDQKLGLELSVSPNFVTQECQWSFGETPIEPVADDPTFPTGCLTGCTSRQQIATNSKLEYRDLCNN